MLFRKILLMPLIISFTFNVSAQNLENNNINKTMSEFKRTLLLKGYKILPDSIIKQYISDQYRYIDEEYVYTIIQSVETTCKNMLVVELINPETSYSDETKSVIFIFPYINSDILSTQLFLKKRNNSWRSNPDLFDLDKENEIRFSDEYKRLEYYMLKFNVFVDTYRHIWRSFYGFISEDYNTTYDYISIIWINKDSDTMTLENSVLTINGDYIRQNPLTSVGINMLKNFWSKSF